MRTYWRKSDSFLVFVAICGFLLVLLYVHSCTAIKSNLARLQQTAKVVETLSLTDLCLATEAHHTRYPSQSDWHAPFQTHPLSLEHFPSGAIIQPPRP